ncbi:polysaccharide lyase family 8 super-sandwich domain-containing protein [Mycoplasmopsis alligatoris]|uniref:Polysaccharide lyase family 8, super-sandwich domain protein n=1 Tax=Mycoplasmopsis alligatoris A21JP2 TaxID=747682 RepID=D4XUV2_9BACT|nr:polysaccharide lyase family 8 super-sandwich domain-containing protein [Mycoplasmopsis alligatoris]EFF41862.1 polysaccharide lyase family 8, super-sandwich domain protein [Mycoplasmopsis alligatoris A21JP2]
MKRKNILILGSILAMPLIPLSAISCGSDIAEYKWSTADKYGKPIPREAKDLHKYLKFIPIEESIQSVSAKNAQDVLNNADLDMKVNALKSFALPENELMPEEFDYDLKAEANGNSLNITLFITEKKNGSKSSMNIVLNGFRDDFELSDKDQEIINNNILEINGLKYLIDGIDKSKLNATELKNRTNAYKWSQKIINKYNELKYPENPIANFFYASTYDNGIKKIVFANDYFKNIFSLFNSNTSELVKLIDSKITNKNDELLKKLKEFETQKDTVLKLNSTAKYLEKTKEFTKLISPSSLDATTKKEILAKFADHFTKSTIVELNKFSNANNKIATNQKTLSPKLNEFKTQINQLKTSSDFNLLDSSLTNLNSIISLIIEQVNIDNAISIQNAEFLALQGAYDLINKKEIQVVKNNETGVIVNPGYSDAPYVRTALQKMLFIAQAYLINEPDNKLYKNQDLKKIIIQVMDDFAKKYYFRNQQQFVNWWFYEIGIPRELTKLLGVLNKVFNEELKTNEFKDKFEKWSDGINYFLPNARYGGAAKTAIINYVPVTKKRIQTGANVIDTAKPILATAILNKNTSLIQDALMAMYDNLFREFVKTKDGFYKDGSFIQHDNLPYAGSYGEVLYTGIADIFKYFENSSFDLSKDKRFERIYKFTELAVMPYVFNLSISDGLSGRSLVRLGHGDKQKGMNILGALTIIVKNAPELYKARLNNFIIEQLSLFSKEDLVKFGKDYKIRDVYVNNLIEYKTKEKMTVLPRNKEDWEFYETSYFNKYNEPSTRTDSLKDKNNVPVGSDLALSNNGLVFSKNQDRYVWKTDNFMFNINLHGRTIGFPEATLGENLESYYYADGATTLHTKANNNPYANEYWTILNPELVPGTSSIHTSQFDKLYAYNFPDQLGADVSKWTDKTLKKQYDDFTAALRDKQKKIEDNVSLHTNDSFNNGIIYKQDGFVKSMVENWNSSLITRKVYFMIDNQIITVGNVHFTNPNNIVTTTIENRSQANENSASYKKEKFLNKEIFVYENKDNNEVNGYVVLDNIASSKLNKESKYPILANVNRSFAKEKNKINKLYNTLTIDHKTNKKFAYSTIPNYDKTKKNNYETNLKNFKIILNNHDYIIASYTKLVDGKESTTYYIASFVEENKSKIGKDKDYDAKIKTGIYVPGLDTKIYLSSPTTMVIETEKNSNRWNIISSSDLNLKNYEIYFDKQFSNLESKLVTNDKIEYSNKESNEVKLFVKNATQSGVSVFNNFALNNDINHNAWFTLEVKNEK